MKPITEVTLIFGISMIIILLCLLISVSYVVGHTKGVSDGKIEVMSQYVSGAIYCVTTDLKQTHVGNFTITCQGVYPK